VASAILYIHAPAAVQSLADERGRSSLPDKGWDDDGIDHESGRMADPAADNIQPNKKAAASAVASGATTLLTNHLTGRTVPVRRSSLPFS